MSEAVQAGSSGGGMCAMVGPAALSMSMQSSIVMGSAALRGASGVHG